SCDDRAMETFVLEWILREPPRRGCPLSKKSPETPGCIRDVRFVRPDCPELQPERCMDDVENHGRSQDRTGDPLARHPRAPPADLGKKSGEEQREHRCRHQPMERARDLSVTRHSLWNRRDDLRRCCTRPLFLSPEESDIRSVNDQKRNGRNERHLDQEPRDVDGNSLAPGIYCPL